MNNNHNIDGNNKAEIIKYNPSLRSLVCSSILKNMPKNIANTEKRRIDAKVKIKYSESGYEDLAPSKSQITTAEKVSHKFNLIKFFIKGDGPFKVFNVFMKKSPTSDDVELFRIAQVKKLTCAV